MRRPLLIGLLSACGLLAIYPSVVWSLAWAYNAGPEWRAVLGHTTFALPIALGLAAIILVVHGLLLNAGFHEQALEEFEELRELEHATLAATGNGSGDPGAGLVTAGAPPGAAQGAGTATPAPPVGASVSATEAPEAPSRRGGGKDSDDGAPKKRATKGQRLRRRAQSAARSQVRRRTGW